MKRFNFKGDIISDSAKWFYDWLEMPSVTHGDILKFLEDADGEDIEIFIDSPGGLLNVGSDIYGELRAYKGNSTSYILGIAGSAASIAMLGAQKTIAIPTARVVIHNTQSRAEGDYRDMKEAYARLKEANESVINAYEIKTGMTRTALQNLMDKTTSMSAQSALEYGFIDEIALKEGEHLSSIENAISSADFGGMIGGMTFNAFKLHEIADKVKDIIDKDPEKEPEGEPPDEAALLLPENRGTDQPVSDKDPGTEPENGVGATDKSLEKQRSRFMKTKNKILKIYEEE